MSDNNFKLSLIDNISAPLVSINNAIKNTTKFVNELNSTLNSLQFNVLNVNTFKIEINQVQQSIRDSKTSFADYIGKLADWITIITSISINIKTLSDLFRIIKNTTSEFITNGIDGLTTGFTLLKGKLQELTGTLGGYIKQIILTGTETLKSGIRIAATALRGIGLFIVNIISATAAQWGFNIAISANPLGLLIIGIMAVIGAIVLVISYWDEIKAAIARFVVWVFENSPFGFLINVVDNIFPGFKDALGGLFDWVVNTFTQIADFIKGIWTNIKSWFGFGDDDEATITVTHDETVSHLQMSEIYLTHSTACSPEVSEEVRYAA